MDIGIACHIFGRISYSNAFGILSIKACRIPSNKLVAILHRFGPARFLGFRTAMIVTIDNPEY